jgi:hypothetical protein
MCYLYVVRMGSKRKQAELDADESERAYPRADLLK